MAMHQSDLIIAVGSRFDDRVTGRLDAFAPTAKKIHIDIDPSSINKNVPVDLPLIGDCGVVLSQMVAGWKAKKLKAKGAELATWWERINGWRERKCLAYRQEGDVIKPQYALERLQAALDKDKRDTYITTEVGQHQMWAAQYLKFEKPNRWMTSGGLGTMGYGLPASIGVQVAHPDALVVDV